MKMRIIFTTITSILAAVSVVSVASTPGDGPPLATTPQGPIQGTIRTSYKGRKYAAFEGIPFAKPPTGQRRFQAPEPADKWNDILIANRTYICLSFWPIPMMKGAKGDEDCLYLYVYVPKETINPNDNMDVVVHIHGGAFMLGSPDLMADPTYIMDKDVISVSMNYRLGILGFLSTEDEVVPGNNGLKDQVLALQWIQTNIRSFGGNPESVTLTGLSAGASSVHYHYLSPMSKGLFHRGFSQSGTALQCWSLTEDPLTKAKIVAVKLNCPTNCTRKMVQCLRELPAKEVVLAIRELLVLIDAVPYTPFGPVVEQKHGDDSAVFLPQHPYKLMADGAIYDVPWVTSHVKHEGLFPVEFFVMFNVLKNINEHWMELGSSLLDFNRTVTEAEKNNVLTSIRQHYFGDDAITNTNIYSLVQLFTDRLFLVDAEKAIRLQATKMKSPVYYYHFAYKIEQPFLASDMEPGIGHSDDGKLLFRIVISPAVLTDNDASMVDHFTTFMADYARTGVPKFGNVEWTPVVAGAEEIPFLEITSPTDIAMKSSKSLTASAKFWDSLPIRENDKLF